MRYVRPSRRRIRASPLASQISSTAPGCRSRSLTVNVFMSDIMSAFKPKSSGAGSRKDRNPRLRRSSTLVAHGTHGRHGIPRMISAAAPQLKDSTVRYYRRKQRTQRIQTEAQPMAGNAGNGLDPDFDVRRCMFGVAAFAPVHRSHFGRPMSPAPPTTAQDYYHCLPPATR